MNFKISDAVKRTGLTAHAIRYYTDKGLVRGLKRDEDNNRIFTDEALNYLRAIRFLRLAGLSIKEIERYFNWCDQGNTTKPERIAMMKEVLASLKEQEQNLQIQIRLMEERIDHIQNQDENSVDDSNPANWDLSKVCTLSDGIEI